MAFLSSALHGLRARGTDFKERVREQALSLVGDVAQQAVNRAQQFEEAVASNLQGGTFSAREVESRLEADARSLSRTVQATEVLQRWLILLRSSPQPRYPETLLTGVTYMEGSSRQNVQLTFRQVFLRSQTLELALDAVARVPELRSNLREFALPSPEVWPDDLSPPVAFAHAFVMLLCATIGPTKVWLPLIGALLSSDKGPTDEPCHAWIVQLAAGMRSPWVDVGSSEHEQDVEAIEDQAEVQCRSVEQAGVVEASSASLVRLLEDLGQRGRAAGTAYRAWSMRSKLAAEFDKATARQRSAGQMRAGSAAAVASAATERASVLEAESAKLFANIEELQRSLGAQASELREQLDTSAPSSQQIQREIEEAEIMQAELLKQVKTISERLDKLRLRCAEKVEHESKLRSEYQRVDKMFKDKLIVEEKAQQRAENARGLAATVRELALGLASVGSPNAKVPDLQTSHLAAEADRHRKKAMDSAFILAEREVKRFELAEKAVDVCVAVAEEREQSREALEKAGVPALTLESDVVGEAEIAQCVEVTIRELDNSRADAEALCRALGRLASGDSPGDCAESKAEALCRALDRLSSDDPARSSIKRSQAEAALSSRASELGTILRQCLQRCDEKRAQLATFMPQVEAINIATPPLAQESAEMETTDAFLLGDSIAPILPEMDPALRSALVPTEEGSQPSQPDLLLHSALVPAAESDRRDDQAQIAQAIRLSLRSEEERTRKQLEEIMKATRAAEDGPQSDPDGNPEPAEALKEDRLATEAESAKQSTQVTAPQAAEESKEVSDSAMEPQTRESAKEENPGADAEPDAYSKPSTESQAVEASKEAAKPAEKPNAAPSESTPATEGSDQPHKAPHAIDAVEDASAADQSPCREAEAATAGESSSIVDNLAAAPEEKEKAVEESQREVMASTADPPEITKT